MTRITRASFATPRNPNTTPFTVQRIVDAVSTNSVTGMHLVNLHLRYAAQGLVPFPELDPKDAGMRTTKFFNDAMTIWSEPSDEELALGRGQLGEDGFSAKTGASVLSEGFYDRMPGFDAFRERAQRVAGDSVPYTYLAKHLKTMNFNQWRFDVRVHGLHALMTRVLPPLLQRAVDGHIERNVHRMTLAEVKALRAKAKGSVLETAARYAVNRVAGITHRYVPPRAATATRHARPAGKVAIVEPASAAAFLDSSFISCVIDEHYAALYSLPDAVRARFDAGRLAAADAAANVADKTFLDVTKMCDATIARSILYRVFVAEKWEQLQRNDEACGRPETAGAARGARLERAELSRVAAAAAALAEEGEGGRCGVRPGEEVGAGDEAEVLSAEQAAQDLVVADAGADAADAEGAEEAADVAAAAAAAEAAAELVAAEDDAVTDNARAVEFAIASQPSCRQLAFTQPVVAVGCRWMRRSVAFDFLGINSLLGTAHQPDNVKNEKLIEHVFDINGARGSFERMNIVVTNGVSMSIGYTGSPRAAGAPLHPPRDLRAAHFEQPQNWWARPGSAAANAYAEAWAPQRAAAGIDILRLRGQKTADAKRARAAANANLHRAPRPWGPRDPGGRTRAMAVAQVRSGGRSGAFDPGLKNILTWFEQAPKGPNMRGFTSRLTQGAYYCAIDAAGRARRGRVRMRAVGDDVWEALSRVSPRAPGASGYADYVSAASHVLARVMAEKLKPYWANAAFRAWQAKTRCIARYLAGVEQGNAQNKTWGIRPVMFHGDGRFPSSVGGMRSSPTVTVARAVVKCAGFFAMTVTEMRSTMCHATCGEAMHRVWGLQHAPPPSPAAARLARTLARIGIYDPGSPLLELCAALPDADRLLPADGAALSPLLRPVVGSGQLHGLMACSNPACAPANGRFPFAIVSRDKNGAEGIHRGAVSLVCTGLLPAHMRPGPRMPRPATRYMRPDGFMSFAQGVAALER